MSWYGGYGDWKPYVPVAKRREKAAKYAASLAKKEKRTLAPVKIEGRKIAKSFWGMSWCENLERYSDYSNRLPRGGTYARNGSVIDLQIGKGVIKALVSGSEVYTVKIVIETLAHTMWAKIKQDCSRSIDSLLDLLQGKFDRGIMERLTHRDEGLFPKPKEIRLNCSCPDSAGMCKHIAAVMYGVGNRLDSTPELLFLLRAVDHLELISEAASAESLDRALTSGQNDSLAGSDLGEIFGIELDLAEAPSLAIGAEEPKIEDPSLVPRANKTAASVQTATAATRKSRTKKVTKAPTPEPTSAGSPAKPNRDPAERAVRSTASVKTTSKSSAAEVAAPLPVKSARKGLKSKQEVVQQAHPKAASRVSRKSVPPVAEVVATKKRQTVKASKTASLATTTVGVKSARVRKVTK
jgi:uncharacterized Zn finger protein